MFSLHIAIRCWPLRYVFMRTEGPAIYQWRQLGSPNTTFPAAFGFFVHPEPRKNLQIFQVPTSSTKLHIFQTLQEFSTFKNHRFFCCWRGGGKGSKDSIHVCYEVSFGPSNFGGENCLGTKLSVQRRSVQCDLPVFYVPCLVLYNNLGLI